MSIVYKETAAAVSPDLTFVLSDATVDRMGDTIDPAGWDLRWFKKNPIALFGHDNSFPIGNWADVRVEGGKLLGRLVMAAAGTSARIDEIRRLVEQGILKAVSVGFKPIEADPKDKTQPWGAQTYRKQELLETSLVSVPANPAALAVAKSLNISDDTLRMAFGEHANEGRGGRGTTGEKAAPTTPVRKTNPMDKTISERVIDAQDALLAAEKALTDHTKHDGYDIDVEAEFSADVERAKAALASLKRVEAAMAAKAAAAPAVKRSAVPAPDLKPGDLVIRSAVVHALAFATKKGVDEILDQRYPGHEATSVVTKADMTIGTTGTSGWAAELVNTELAAFINTLRPMSVLPDLLAMGTSLSFGSNQGAIKLPARAAGTNVNASFVAEGGAIPVRRIATTSTTLTPRKVGVISAFSKELAKYSTPAIESLIRSEMQADTAVYLDGILLDSTASSSTRPAGLLNGVSAAATAYGGGDYQAVLADLAALIAPFDTANAGRSLALIMHPAQARKLRMMPGPDGTFGWADRFLGDFRVLASTSATQGTIIAVDAADFAGAYGNLEFDVSEQATLHMEDTTPLEIVSGTGPTTADPVRSLFQTASIAVRMLLDVSWAMRRTGMVQYISGVTW